MGHHFDSPEARADSRINITDNYLFHSPTAPDRVIAVMCVSPLAGLPSPYHGQPQWRTFRPGTAYDLRFDSDGDLEPDTVLRLVFTGDVAPQTFQLSRLDGAAARSEHAAGTVLGRGQCESTLVAEADIRVWVGEAGDPFWLDAVAAKGFLDKMLAEGPFEPDAFSGGAVTTGATNVLAIVVDLPLAWFGGRPCHFWTTVSANDHGHWHQVARCGRPNFAATFIDDPQRSRLMNDTTPVSDVAEFSRDVEAVVRKVVTAAGNTADPAGYARRAARALLPDVLPFDPALPSGFDFAGINGRGLRDDFGAVVYSVVFNHPMRTRLQPLADLRANWPYLPLPRPLPSGPAVSVPERNG